MSFVKLDEKHQRIADHLYFREKEFLAEINEVEKIIGLHRWVSIGITHIEQGFMALRKAVTVHFKQENPHV